MEVGYTDHMHGRMGGFRGRLSALVVAVVVTALAWVRDVGAVPHPLPPTVQQANAELPARQRQIIKAWVDQFRKSPHFIEFPRWDGHASDPEGAVRMIAAGAAVFRGRPSPGRIDPIWDGAEQERLELAKNLGFVANGPTEEGALQEWKIVLSGYAEDIVRRSALGTDHYTKQCSVVFPPDPKLNQHCGDYDFVLLGAISLATIFHDVPDILTNDVVNSLVTHGELRAGGAGEPPFLGTDLADGLMEGTPEHDWYLREDGSQFVDYVTKLSTPETENHLLAMYAWRYLAHNYLEWVANLDSQHPRYDSALVSLYHSHPGRYENDGAVTDFLLKMLARFTYYGAFETNAKPYSAITMQALLALASYADTLFPCDPERQKVKTAATNALDYLAAEFAFQSYEGKRIAPMRRSSNHKNNVHPYANHYVPHLLGALTGAYVFDDSVTLEETAEPHTLALSRRCEANPEDIPTPVGPVSCPCGRFTNPNTSQCNAEDFCSVIEDAELDVKYELGLELPGILPDFTCMCTCEVGFHETCQDCGDVPFLNAGAEAGYALWAALSNYRVPPAVHDYMLNKHSGYWARIQSGYRGSHYPLNVTVAIEQGDPADPAPAPPQYEIHPASELLTPFKPVQQYYFATRDYVNSAGGRNTEFYPRHCTNEASSFSSLSIECSLLPTSCSEILPMIVAEAGFCPEVPQIATYDVMARPYTVLGRGRLGRNQGTDVNALATQTLVMAGRQDTATSRNLDTYKSFSYGYRHHDDDDIHLEWPMDWPDAWEPTFLASSAVMDRALFYLFDFRSAPADHPLVGQYLITARVSKSENETIHRRYARGFWEIVPGTRFASVEELRNNLVARNPVSNYNDVSSSSYVYTLSSTGETLILDPLVGFSDHGILEIRDAAGVPIPQEQFHFAPQSQAQPLIQVWEVDDDYAFTGNVLALAPGDGTLVVENPHVSETLSVDSSDYANPTNSGVAPNAQCSFTPESEPRGWYVASSADLVFESNGTVSRWKDRTANALDLVQDFAPGRPSYLPSGWQGSQPTLRFPGGKLLRRESWSGPPAGESEAFTLLAVVQPDANQGSVASIAAFWNGWDSIRLNVVSSGTQNLLQAFRLDGIGNTQTFSSSLALGAAAHVVAWRYVPGSQGSNDTFILDLDGTRASQAVSPIAGVWVNAFYVGYMTAFNGSFVGNISELVLFDDAISDQQVADFRAYAKNKWTGLP